MGGKTLLGYCFKTLLLRKKVSKMPILPRLPFKPFIILVRYLYKIIYLPLPYSALYIYVIYNPPIYSII